MDQYQELRALPLWAVLAHLGAGLDWKERKGGSERYGRCPLHQAKKNNTSFSFDDTGRFNCFSCGKHGKGAIDLTMALREIGFQEAVEILRVGLGAENGPSVNLGGSNAAYRPLSGLDVIDAEHEVIVPGLSAHFER